VESVETYKVSEIKGPIFEAIAIFQGNKQIFQYKNKISGNKEVMEQIIHRNMTFIPDVNGKPFMLDEKKEREYESYRRFQLELELEKENKLLFDFKNEIDALIYQPRINWDEITEKIKDYFLQHNQVYTTREDENPEMWIYKEGIYIPEAKTYIKEFCENILRDKLTSQLCNKIIFKIEVKTYIEQKDFFKNEDINLIAVSNGILNIITKELNEFDPKYRFFNKLDIIYGPDKKGEVFNNFFKEIVVEKDISLIQELFGYCLYREYPIHKCFMFNGVGRNGKGTTLNLINTFLGINNVIDLTLKDMEHDTFTFCRLQNKMVNLSGDIDSSYVENTGTFKKLTGGDIITAKRKFKTDISFKNYAKMIFACNELPKFKDDSEGLKSRWILIDFPYRFIEPSKYDKLDPLDIIKNNIKKMDVNKCKNLTSPTNMTILLNWALEGLERLLKNMSFSEGNFENVFLIWEMKNNSCIKFVKQKCILDYGQSISVSEFKHKYGKYCQENKIKTESSKVIESTLEKKFGVFKNRTNTSIIFEGINVN